jgi:glycosyltransferase involved in cell wall biosynthesis
MPVLFQISIEVNSGSVGRIAEQIGGVALDNGWESYITYARNHLPSKSTVVKIGTKWDIYWHGIMTRIFDRHCLYSTDATRKLIKQIEKIKPDIIQLHHIHGYFIDMKLLFNYLSSINTPVIWVFHDCWSMTGHCAYFDYIGCEKWKTQCYCCPQKKEYPKSLIFDRSKENYGQKKYLFNLVKSLIIVPVSEWLGGLVKESFFFKYPIEIIHNGIDLSVFSPQEDGQQLRKDLFLIDSSVILLGVASTWDARKGLLDFIKLASMIPTDWRIILVGLSQKQMRGLPANIIGIQRTENVQQLASLYSAANVFINPTWEDTFPTTNLESLACGTPVITYRTGGSVESVSKDTGFIVDKGDLHGIIECTKEVIKNGAEYYFLKCRSRAVNLYNKSDSFQNYIKLYNRLLNIK